MFPFLINIYRFLRAIWQGLKDEEFRALFFLVIVTLGTGMVFYHEVEKFSWLDSLYFCVTTLTTVGFGDLTPHTALGKAFTILYIFIGIGIIIAFITAVADHARNDTGPRLGDIFKRKEK